MGWMTLISDNHGRELPVRPDSLLVLLGGDICPDLTGAEAQAEWMDRRLRHWLRQLPCPCVAVPGNHDKAIWKGIHPRDLDWTLLLEPRLAHVAASDIWGMPYVLDGTDGGFATEEKIEEHLRGMPERCDILLSHNPPLGILDHPSNAHHIGSLALRVAIWKKKPRLSVFGHIHEARGHKKVGDTYCVNATLGASCNNSGHPTSHPYGPWGLSDGSWRH